MYPILKALYVYKMCPCSPVPCVLFLKKKKHQLPIAKATQTLIYERFDVVIMLILFVICHERIVDNHNTGNQQDNIQTVPYELGWVNSALAKIFWANLGDIGKIWEKLRGNLGKSD